MGRPSMCWLDASWVWGMIGSNSRGYFFLTHVPMHELSVSRGELSGVVHALLGTKWVNNPWFSWTHNMCSRAQRAYCARAIGT